MATVVQILFVLALIILVILFAFRPRTAGGYVLPENYAEMLLDYVPFYANLHEEGRKTFDKRLRHFLASVRITGAGAQVEDLDRLLIGAAAVMPVFYIPDWEYVNLREVLLYPGHFNQDFDQEGSGRTVSGMVGSGGLENVMILTKWELRQGFINSTTARNTAVHEFVHLIDKMDGTLDGVPELLLERTYTAQWKALLEATMTDIRNGISDIDAYGATSPVECFAVLAEYFFEQPETFRERHPQLTTFMEKIFIRRP